MSTEHAPHMCPGCFARPAAHGEQLCRVCQADYDAATAIVRATVARLRGDFAREVGMNPITLHARIRKGWSVERALTIPARTKKPNAGTAVST